ncbi:unnamed protein product [Protopolystoma xenopodis]|uniref:BolA-like protein 3 n=1 Tax=Protopolystoma xenopodis TaxID=117903 RepID=A0A448XCJ4_9PLAT|nr:unnamed protein product [Protopolystoma xenopodis]
MFMPVFGKKPCNIALFARLLATVGETRLTKILAKTFVKARLIEVSDVSGGCGAMYKIRIESEDFGGMSVLSQHRAVKEALKSEIKDMHGLTISTKY